MDISKCQWYSLLPAYVLQIHKSGRAVCRCAQAWWVMSKVQFPVRYLLPQKLGVSCHVMWNLRVVTNTALCHHRDSINIKN